MADASPSDSPITSPDQDKLGRFGVARQVADQILHTPASEGFVVGLLGPWGSGKTSILNLAQGILATEAKDDVIVVRFNPWLFAGAEQLVARFFAELSAVLKLKKGEDTQKLARLLVGYGKLIEPLAFVPGAILLGKALVGGGGWLTERYTKKSVEAERAEVRRALAKAGKRLVFILDDIDRLNNAEILDIMRLVRLVGDFPNCIYVLAFDRKRVEEALQPISGDGRAYLEKILQFVNEVPPARRSDLSAILLQGIQSATDAGPHGPFDPDLWANVYHLGMLPLFANMRDVRRYLNGLGATLRIIGEEVAVGDVLALEAVRVLRPGVFELLPDAVAALTTPSSSYGPSNAGHQAQLEHVLEVAGGDRKAIEELLTRLCPACQQYLRNTHFNADKVDGWSRARRVAHERMLRFYLERSYPQGTMSNSTIATFVDAFGGPEELSRLMEAMTTPELEHVFERLLDYRDDFPPETVEPAIVAILKQLHRMSPERRDIFDDPEMKLVRVLYRLLKRVEGQPIMEAMIGRIVSRDDLSLRAKRIVTLMAGHEEGAGHKFISSETAKRFEQELSAAIAAADAEQLAAEQDLIRLVVWVHQHGTPLEQAQLQEKILEIPVLPNLLASCLSDRQRQTFGDVAVQRWMHLDWDVLVKYLGEGPLKLKVESLSSEGLSGKTRDAVDLARRYATGWRPDEFP